ncbi:MAG TPA: tyrosine-type recombinase/integrase, partial [Polyangiaceae bacterium]
MALVGVASAPDPGSPEAGVYAPADRHPVRVYLASLALGSRRTMRQALDVIARLLSPPAARTGAMDLPWHELGYQHVAAVRARLAATYAPTTANKMLAALKGVVRQAFALGLMGAEACSRILMVKSVRGSRVPKGRSVSQLELRELFAICDPRTPGGARDAALLGVAYGTGLRRSELVGLNLGDFDRRT